MNYHQPSTNLESIIINKIGESGPISFRDYMEMALYHPVGGYYTAESEKIGKEGDFQTSPSITGLFGEMISKQLEEMWVITGREDFTVVEYGAGNGTMCRDILACLKANLYVSPFYNRMQYYIIEKSPAMRKKQQQVLGSYNDKVRWIDSLDELCSFTGCVLANEVVDNFAVHQVVMEDELMEIFVDHHDNAFMEIIRPASELLIDYLQQQNITLPKGYKTEINIEAIEWIKDIAQHLNSGFVLTIDYGYSATDYYHESRTTGTLLCYNKHTRSDRPYENIGMQDITAHVNFSSLHHWGAKYGLQYCGFTNQAQFLISLGLANHLRKLETEQKLSNTAGEKQGFLQNFLMDMGKKFKILVQAKSVPPVRLMGLRMAV